MPTLEEMINLRHAIMPMSDSLMDLGIALDRIQQKFIFKPPFEA